MESKKSIKIDLSHIREGLFLCIDGNGDKDIKEDILNDYTNEARVKIWEGKTYDYKLTNKKYRLACSEVKNIIQVRKNKGDEHLGQITPNIYVGTLNLDIFHKNRPDEKSNFQIEVQSTKTSYRSDYQFMLNSIAEHCTDLIIQANSPVSHSFESNFEEDNESLYQKFAFVNAMVGSEDFELAIGQIVSAPTMKWKDDEQLIHVSRIKKFSSRTVRAMINGSDKVRLPDNHFLRDKGIDNIALKIPSNRKIDSLDTPENRFIKFALESFLKFAEDIELHPNARERLKSEAKVLVDGLNSHLQENLFKEVSRPTTLRLNSPVLQRKSGYRQVLNVWNKFDLAAKLVWNGGLDVYKAGNKNVAVLYEYWVFFELLELVQKVFQLKANGLEKLIKESSDGLSLQLTQGNVCCMEGVYTSGNRKLNVKFNYNRSFSYTKNRDKRGSWSTGMRPDYTISIWPDLMSEPEAELEEEIVHIHFDAKYKIANINSILNAEKERNFDKEKKRNLEGIYKNADLLKMHAYKDAIRRTGGAYVLYPGDIPKEYNGFHEILPGLGAFPLKPNEEQSGIQNLEFFLRTVLGHFLDRAAQRDNLAFKTYDIVKEEPLKALYEPLPEKVDGEKLIAKDVSVLLGYYKSQRHLDWIIGKDLYNIRYGQKYTITGEMVTAKYLLLYNKEDLLTGKIFKLSKEGPTLHLKKELKKNFEYPSNPSEEMYFIYKLKDELEDEFKGRIWDVSSIIESEVRGTPNTISLEKLMRLVKP